MATAPNSRRRTSASSKTKGGKSSPAAGRSGASAAKKNSSKKRSPQPEESFLPVVLLFVVFCVLVILCLCMFGVIKGSFGPFVRSLMLGLFGLLAYVLPLILIAAMFYQVFIAEYRTPGHKLAGFILILVFLGMFLAFLGTDLEALSAQLQYQDTFFDKLGFLNKQLYSEAGGGGVLLGIPALIFHGLFGKGGGLFVIILFIIFSFLLIGGRGFFDNMMEIVSGQREIVSRKNRYQEEEEWIDEDEAARLEEEARAAREERRRKHIEQQREAARKRAHHEEEVRIAQEERERVKEEKRIRKQENERRRKEAEERAEDERILSTSNPGRRRLNQAAFEMGVPGRHKLDDIHEITLLPNEAMPGGSEAGFISGESASDNTDTKRIYEDEIREVTLPSDTAKAEAVKENISDDAAGIKNDIDNIKIRPYEEVKEITAEPEAVKEETEVKETVSENVKPQEELPLKPKPSFFDEEDTVPEKKEDRAVSAPAPAEVKKTPAAAEETKAAQNAAPQIPYEKPPISLLKDPKKGTKKDTEAELKETALLLQQTLKSFGVVATVNDISQGPSVTRFELQLGEGIKVNKIVNLADDLKLNLAAEEIRIEAPIPGKAAVGIEIPNKERIPVSLKELIESAEFKKASSKLTFVVGKDISGHVIVGDIGKMPHLLVAGTTGSGKSVFTNSIIQSILFNADPDEVKLILIDPKVVEFSVYNGIPHLLMPVVTEPRKANVALAWAVAEMGRRYKLFADHDVRGIDAYNEQVDQGKVLEDDGSVAKKLPKIVIVVDDPGYAASFRRRYYRTYQG